MIPFTKAHACGNDFLFLEESFANRRHAEIARHLCARTTGIGADGIEFLDRHHRSGELAAFLAHTEHRREIILGTHGGPRHCRVLSSSGSTWEIETGMGTPRVMQRSLSFLGLPDGATEIAGAMVNVGNPHFVLFVDTEDFSAHGLPWQQLGALISGDPRFPHGTNVEFVQVLDPDRIAFRIFERGCGPTTSSGTGTCASTAAAMALRGTARALTALAEGGAQTVVWPSPHSEMLLTGPAELLCQGQAFDPATQPGATVEDIAL